MNKLSLSKRTQILSLLVEGNSLRSTSRIAGASINTVTKLLIDLGCACSTFQYRFLRDLSCKRIQVDEIWSFCYSKQKNISTLKKAILGAGDVWTWTAICADTKLVPSWLVGSRSADCAKIFIQDLASRMKSRIQLSSDGYKPYLEAVENAFGGEIDYGMLMKVYGESTENEKRYSPADCVKCIEKKIIGTPDEKHISTSFAERNNLTMRMSMRRFTRLTNAFSKKIENHGHAVSLHFMYYNFGRIHKSLRITPAMAAGVSKHIWSLEEIASLTNSYSN